jgi:hypothetical protein
MTNQLSVVNPQYAGGAAPQPQRSFAQRYGKALLVVGVVAVVGAVAFVAGEKVTASQASVSTPTSGSGDESTAVAAARSTLMLAFSDSSVQATTSKLAYEDLEAMLLQYRGNKAAFAGPLKADAMEAVGVLYDAFQRDLAAPRSLRSATEAERKENYRRMLGKLDLKSPIGVLAKKAWAVVAAHAYPDQVTSADGHDRATVFVEGDDCYVLAEESLSDEDWTNNKKQGSTPILALWDNSTIGKAYTGFTEAYNSMRVGIAQRIDARCKGKRIVLVGYSRGGAIMNIIAYALRRDGRFNAQTMVLITFGCPRTLGDAASDFLYAEAKKFTHLRLIYKKDPVAAIPFSWMGDGLKHAIEPNCFQCGYTESRDAPGWGWPNDQKFHSEYKVWFA